MFLTYGYGCLPVRVRVSPYGYPYPYELPALGVFTAGNSWGFQRHVFLLGLQGVRSRYPYGPPESGFRRTDIRIRTNSRGAGPLFR